MSDYIPDVKYPQAIKCPVVLLLDTSGSMRGKPIRELNDGVRQFLNEIKNDTIAKKSVEIEAITFGDDPSIENQFMLAEDFQNNFHGFSAGGWTNMGQGMMLAIEELNNRKQFLRTQGINYYRPWIVMITDGEPTDMQQGDSFWDDVRTAIHNGERNKKFVSWAFGTETANMSLLKELMPPNRVYKISNNNFKSIFMWLSQSMERVSSSVMGDIIKIPQPSEYEDIDLEL